MDLNHALRFLGFPEDEIPALLEEANAYDPALLERAFADEAMECLPSGCAKKLLGTGLSASFVFHLAMRTCSFWSIVPLWKHSAPFWAATGAISSTKTTSDMLLVTSAFTTFWTG